MGRKSNISVGKHARVGSDAKVRTDEAWVRHDALIADRAYVGGQVRVFGDARITGSARIGSGARVSRSSRVVTATHRGTSWTAYRTKKDGVAVLRGSDKASLGDAPAALRQGHQMDLVVRDRPGS